MGEFKTVRGGRSRFVVESKAFEILVEDSGGKLKGCIWREVEALPLGLDLGRLVFVAYWKMLKPIAERLMIKDGLLNGWRET